MAKQSGLGDQLYIGGFDISGDTNSLSKISGSMAPIDVTDITQSANSRLGGLRDGGVDFTAYHDPTGAHVPLSALPVTDVIATYFRGSAIGSPAASCNGLEIDYAPTRGHDGSLTFAVSVQADKFGLEWGVQLTPGHRVDSAATAAGAANSLDTGGSLSFGAQMYVQLFAFTGTSVTIALWDSADNVTFNAVASLTTAALSAPNQAVRVAIGNTATVRRYVAVATTGTFSNADFAVQVSKNPVAGVVF